MRATRPAGRARHPGRPAPPLPLPRPLPTARSARPRSASTSRTTQEHPVSPRHRTPDAGPTRRRHPMSRAKPTRHERSPRTSSASSATTPNWQPARQRAAATPADQRLAVAGGLHRDGLAAICQEHPAAVDRAFADNRSEVLGAANPLAAIRDAHWRIHSASINHPTGRRGEPTTRRRDRRAVRQLVHEQVAAGRTQNQTHHANLHQLATTTKVAEHARIMGPAVAPPSRAARAPGARRSPQSAKRIAPRRTLRTSPPHPAAANRACPPTTPILSGR